MQFPNPAVKIKEKEMPKFIIYLLVFLFTLHITPASYINSSFLEQFIGSGKVGYVFSIASFFTLLLFFVIRKILGKIGNYKTFLTFLTLDFISLFVLSLSLIFSGGIWPYIFVGIYILGFISRSICWLNLDIFLEHTTKNSETGGVRGFFLTAANTSFILGPFIAGMMITDAADAGKVYLLSWMILIPVIIMTVRFFRNFHDAHYKRIDTWNTFLAVLKNKNIRKVFSTNFILRFFYSWMIIYTPIYLTKIIGFTLSETTLIISVALIAFILLQIPMGILADRYIGEKEIMTTGFFIMGLSTLSIIFWDSNQFAFWAMILFVTRVGASMVEIMNETYLFKKINDDSVNILSLYRSVRPVAYIISPSLASVLLIFIDIKYLFLVLGIIVLTGIYFSLTLKDSK
jgi:MFS family permease